MNGMLSGGGLSGPALGAWDDIGREHEWGEEEGDEEGGEAGELRDNDNEGLRRISSANHLYLNILPAMVCAAVPFPYPEA